MEVQLQILAKDIIENPYDEADVCPITRAFHRAGFPTLKEVGGDIKDESKEEYILNEKDNPGYKEIHTKVLGMYRTKFGEVEDPDDDRFWSDTPAIPIEDFTVTLELPDQYYKPQN